MNDALRPVARGLKLAHVGFWITIYGGIGIVSVYLVVCLPSEYRVGLLGSSLIALLIGLALGFVGRCRCLALPPELTLPRVRIRLAAMLEWCGLLGGLATVGALLVATRWPSQVLGVLILISSVLSLGSLVAARVCFLTFLRQISELAGDSASARRVETSLLLFCVFVSCTIVGCFLFMFGNGSLPGQDAYRPHPSRDLSIAVGGGLTLVAAVFGLIGLFVYDRLLARLRTAVVQSSWGPVHEGAETCG